MPPKVSRLQVHYPFYIPQLNRQRAIRVLLPRNYWKDSSRRFPVIYLQDGQNLFDPATAAFRHWKLKEFMERQPLKRQAILVGIDHGGVDRSHEYAPYQRGKSGGPKSQIFVSGSKTETRSMEPMLEKTYWALKHGGYSDQQIRVVAKDRGSHSEAFWAREFKPMYEWLFPVTVF